MIAGICAISVLGFMQSQAGTDYSKDIHVTTYTNGWTKNTVLLRDTMVKMGMKKDLANKIINDCKAKAPISPRHCVLIAAAIAKAESNLGNSAYHGNVFGSNAHTSDKDAVDEFLRVYAKYYYKESYVPSDFYRPVGY